MSPTITGHAVTLTIDPEHDTNGFPVEWVIRGPRYVGRFPACSPDCERTPCEKIGRYGVPACKEAKAKGWNRHARELCHSGGHLVQVEAVAARILRTYSPAGRKPHKPGVVGLSERYDPRGFRSGFAMVDGEEWVRVVPRRSEGTPSYRPADHWAVLCSSPHCQRPGARFGDQDVVATVRPDRYDSELSRREAEERAERAREEHVAWHRERFGVSGRLFLSRWISENSGAKWPET